MPEQWKTTNTLEKEFLNTAPGIYTFRVKAIDANGIESEEVLIHFWIKKPWWSSIWFIVGVVLSALMLLRQIVQARISAIEEKAAKEQKIAKKLAELELRALQAQMNPHFISNALTSIQNYILNKSKYEASQYLSTFSHLMRLFLDASIEKYISLEKEIELLKGYIELESLRFPDKFDVVWKIDKAVDTSLEFPSMLLQPFVENAINYGLIHKTTKGCLTLSFSIKGEFLMCVIEDDGIGRERARVLKATSYKSYKSRGMMLVEERLNVLRQIESLESSYTVEDKDPDCEDCGTKVTVTIPLLY